jgi:hypothetical protein
LQVTVTLAPAGTPLTTSEAMRRPLNRTAAMGGCAAVPAAAAGASRALEITSA